MAGEKIRLVGLTGKIGVGESTFAEVLCEEFGGVEFAFAKPIKKVAEVLFPHKNLIEDDKNEKIILGGENLKLSFDPSERKGEDLISDLTYRKLFQILGADTIREHIHRDYFIWQLSREVNEFLAKSEEKNPLIVVSDVRFDNEAKWIKDHGGFIIKIIQKGTALNETSLSEENDYHRKRKSLSYKSKQTGDEVHCSEYGIDLKYLDYLYVNDLMYPPKTPIYDYFQAIAWRI